MSSFPPHRHIIGAVLAGLLTLFAAWIVVSTGQALVRQYHPLPYYDDWHSAREGVAFADGELSWTQFVDQHNEHRVAIPKLVFLTDYQVFDGTGILTQSVITALQALNALLLLLLLRLGTTPTDRRARRIAGSVVLAAMLWAPQLFNLGWNIQLSVIGVYASVTASLTALVLANRTAPAASATRAAWIGLSIVAAFAATFTRANGVLVWPLLVGLGWLLRLRGRPLVAIAVAGAISGSMFFWGYHHPSNTDPIGSFAELGRVVQFALVYLGLPARAFGTNAAMILGGIGATLAAVACGRLVWRRSGLERGEAGLHVLLLFPLTTAAVTAMGRIQFEPPEWPSRYVTPALYFWAVLIAVLARWSISSTSRRPRTALAVAATAFAILLGIQQCDGWRELRSRFDDRRLAALSVGTRVYDEPLMQRITLNMAPVMHDVALWLRERRLTAFAAPRFGWLGRPLDESVDEIDATPDPADGAFSAWEPVTAPTAGIVVKGWLRPRLARSAGIDCVVIVDGDRRVVGLAEVNLSHGEHADGPDDGIPSVPWAGYARILELPQAADLSAFVVVGDPADTSRTTARALAGTHEVALAVDPSSDSLGAQLLALQERGPRDVPSELLASARPYEAFLGVTLPTEPAVGASSAATIERIERLVGSPGLRVRGRLEGEAAASTRAVLVVDDRLRVVGIGALRPDERESTEPESVSFDVTALPLATHDVDWRLCALGEDGGTHWLEQRDADAVPRAPFSSLGSAIAGLRIAVGAGWQRRGVFESYFPAPTGRPVFDSWSGDDRHVGELRIGAISNRGRTAHAIGLPLFLGPGSSGLRVRLVDRATETILATLDDPRPFVGFWRVWRADLPAGLQSDRLAIVITDAGDGFGQWIALTTPHWID